VNKPAVSYQLKIWDNTKKTNIVNSPFKGTTDVDIFDTVDAMSTMILKSTLNIEPGTANIVFDGFKVGKEQYDLVVNNKVVDTVTNEKFTLNLKILPDTAYIVQLLHKPDNKEAFQGTVNLPRYQSITIGYTPFGRVKINPVFMKDRIKTYSIFLDDMLVSEGKTVSNIQAGLKHTVTLKDNLSKEVDKSEFYLKDSDVTQVTLGEKYPSPLHFEAYSLDRSMASLGVDLYIGRYFWLGLGTGGSYFAAGSSPLIFVSPYVETGYYFLGDLAYDLRVGAGLLGKVNMFFPEDTAKAIDSSVNNYSPNAGVFAQVEWKFIMIRPAAYIYFDASQNIQFTYGLGVGVKF
jgi:hypothetical protein